MRVLAAHVHYRQAGGEDAVFATEIGVLRHAGIHVDVLELFSSDVDDFPVIRKGRLGLYYPNHELGRRLIRSAVHRYQPDVIHFHHIYPQLGPGALDEARRLGCGTVQTLHNYRLSCLVGTHLRNGRTCRLCRPGHFAPGVFYACYHDSRLLSLLTANASMYQWRQFLDGGAPDLWLTVTEYMRSHWVDLGAPADRVIVKPSSVGEGHPAEDPRDGVFCGGRLSSEKRIVELMRCWPADAPVLTVAGEGPLAGQINELQRENIRFLGALDHAEFLAAMRRARIVVMPSSWPEPLPLVALESFAQGTPVVAFAGTSLATTIESLSDDCVVDPTRFESIVERAIELASSPRWDELSEQSVAFWRERFSHDTNEKSLLRFYEAAIDTRRKAPVPT